jgi:hypothetical protein
MSTCHRQNDVLRRSVAVCWITKGESSFNVSLFVIWAWLSFISLNAECDLIKFYLGPWIEVILFLLHFTAIDGPSPYIYSTLLILFFIIYGVIFGNCYAFQKLPSSNLMFVY